MKISVSFLKNYIGRKETITKIDESNCDYIHVDICDGKFVSTNNFTLEEIIGELSNTKKPLDVHLMCVDPLYYLEVLATLKPKYVTIQAEIDNISEVIEKIKEKNIEVGIALKPTTSVSKIMPYLGKIDLALVLSVEPGLGGQSFKEEVLSKIFTLNKYRIVNDLKYKISIDGGINDQTIQKCQDRGIDIAVSGSYVCNSNNYDEKINNLRR